MTKAEFIEMRMLKIQFKRSSVWAEYVWDEEESLWIRNDYSCYYDEEVKLFPISFTEQERMVMEIKYS